MILKLLLNFNTETIQLQDFYKTIHFYDFNIMQEI